MMQLSAKWSAKSYEEEAASPHLTETFDAPVPAGGEQMRGDYARALTQGVRHLATVSVANRLGF